MSNETPATTQVRRKRDSHIWDRHPEDHYVDEPWISERLFQEETFHGHVNDPRCGVGTIVEAARRAGFQASGHDLVDRGYADGICEDFLTSTWRRDNVVCNPPFAIAGEFVVHALAVTTFKVAIILPVARLNAANGVKDPWMRGLPLKRVWLITPRVSMLPGHVVAAGKKPGGGKTDYCWLVFDRHHDGPAELRWLHRDGGRP